MVYYRKYRSQTIAELDNAKLRETLYSVFAKKDFPHAFLFTGPKGLGKTSTARIIAKVINCENRSKIKDQISKTQIKNQKSVIENSNSQQLITNNQIEPCNVCETCVSITKGINMDVLEIDGASNRGIDEIRDLREKVRLSPSSARKKVYIIDEVHMLTTEAFNALLKTIEEPPEHVVFIFCTTEPQKVPATIVSRCLHIALTRATGEELVRSFKRIVAGEKIDIDDDVLREIAKLSDGGFRDGAKILEEIVSVAGGVKITKEFVESHYHTTAINTSVTAFLVALHDKNTKQGLEIIRELVEMGIDMKYFISHVLLVLHKMLLIAVGIKEENYELRMTNYELEDIRLLVSLLTKTYQNAKYAVIPQLPLEMLVVAWAAGKEDVQEEKVENNFSPLTSKPSLTSLIKRQQAIKVQSVLGKPSSAEDMIEKGVIKKPVATMKQDEFSDNSDPRKSLLENLIYSMKTYNHSLAAVLRGCTIRQMDAASIVFETAYKFHKERLDDVKSKEILEKVVKELTGSPLVVNVELKGK